VTPQSTVRRLGYRTAQPYQLMPPSSAPSCQRQSRASAPCVLDARRQDVGVHMLGKAVVAGHRVLFAVFFMQADQRAGAFRLQVFDTHVQLGTDAREAIGEGGNQRPVAEVAHRIGADAVNQSPPLRGFQHRRLAGLHHMLRPAYPGGRVGRHHGGGQQPVEQHEHGGELLLHRRRRMGLLGTLYISAKVKWPDRAGRRAARNVRK
jgi:hypothetical protein